MRLSAKKRQCFDKLSKADFANAPTQQSNTLGNFEQPGRAHTARHAHGNDDIFDAAPFALNQGMANQAAAGHPERMANGDAAAIHVQFGRINAQFFQRQQSGEQAQIDELFRLKNPVHIVQYPFWYCHNQSLLYGFLNEV